MLARQYCLAYRVCSEESYSLCNVPSLVMLWLCSPKFTFLILKSQRIYNMNINGYTVQQVIPQGYISNLRFQIQVPRFFFYYWFFYLKSSILNLIKIVQVGFIEGCILRILGSQYSSQDSSELNGKKKLLFQICIHRSYQFRSNVFIKIRKVLPEIDLGYSLLFSKQVIRACLQTSWQRHQWT